MNHYRITGYQEPDKDKRKEWTVEAARAAEALAAAGKSAAENGDDVERSSKNDMFHFEVFWKQPNKAEEKLLSVYGKGRNWSEALADAKSRVDMWQMREEEGAS